ncbi:hypothetical protein D9611_005851 [Ephemerocybe angulata]|uniref:CCHC-type domain-containing protein n=1 Tax=Ephemerocybe angulata TaxID=980116 RepID=A0A8H5CG80_9AGAR|nr:hypothetical protein D9611_005851 [Tulosesus angulatus]
MSALSGISAMVQDINKLDEGNWLMWKKDFGMVFLAVDLDGIASGVKPTETKDLLVWEKTDRKMVAWVYQAVSPPLRYLIEDEVSAASAWKKLQAHFEHVSLATRMSARLALYDVVHDPSSPVSVYFHALESAKSSLAALNVVIDDTEFKDILLMRLDPSYHPIRLSILSQKPEPSLSDIKSLLVTASSVIGVKNEDSSSALAARAPTSYGRSRSDPDPIDDKGNRWCDPTAVGVCHRCGRPGHTAARCMFNMPQKVKDWLMSRSSRRRSPSPSDHANVAAAYHSSSASFANCPNCGTDLDRERPRFDMPTARPQDALSAQAFFGGVEYDPDDGLGGGRQEVDGDDVWQAQVSRITAELPHI